MIHRDIKPENVLLKTQGDALLTDFGIARALAATTDGSGLTETGLAVGTSQHMSPEQAAGERTLDARSDVYALGAVCYEMLAGEPPFVGSSAQTPSVRVLRSRADGPVSPDAAARLLAARPQSRRSVWTCSWRRPTV